MSTLLSAILVASIVGSIHCVAMCGPLIGLAGSARSVRLALVHAVGRLTTYVGLGVAAGLVGRAIDVAGRLGEVQRGATIVAGLVIVGWGVYSLAIAAGWRTKASRAGSLFQNTLVQIRSRRPSTRAWLVGVLTGLLPCGWLWAFVVSAAGTGSPWLGAAVMAVFWVGTVPAMTGVLVLAGPLIDRLRRRLPLITGVVLIALGVGTLALRWTDAGAHGVSQPSCHDPGTAR